MLYYNYTMCASKIKQSTKEIAKYQTIFKTNNNNRHHHSIIETGSQFDVMFHQE